VSAAGDEATTLYWDFWGPRGEGTARHFLRHLDEFLGREGVGGCATAVAQPGPGQWTVSCRTPSQSVDVLCRALRPRRQEPPIP
jgi:hypothetical protein